MNIITAGRTDIQDYFSKSGLFDDGKKKLMHTPFLVFIRSGEVLTVQIVSTPDMLLRLADEVKVMGQWPGVNRSDYFQFTVGQYRAFAKERVAKAKTDKPIDPNADHSTP